MICGMVIHAIIGVQHTIDMCIYTLWLFNIAMENHHV